MDEFLAINERDWSALVEIRPMTNGDVQAVVSIQAAVSRREVEQAWIDLAEQQLNEPEAFRFVAVAGAEVVGFVFGQIKHGDFGLENSGWIDMIGVEPKAMGQGVGQALARASFDWFRRSGVLNIYTSLRWYSGDLMAFFKNMGFDLSDFINLKTSLPS